MHKDTFPRARRCSIAGGISCCPLDRTGDSVQMKRFLTAVTLAVTTLLAVATPAAAAPARSESGLVDASTRVAGFTAGQLLGEEYRQLLELPPDSNPLAGNGDNC